MASSGAGWGPHPRRGGSSHARGRWPHAWGRHTHRSAATRRHPHRRTHRGPHARRRAHHTWRRGSSTHWGWGSSSRWILCGSTSNACSCCCRGNRPSALRGHHLLRRATHSSDWPSESSWSLRHRCAGRDAATCCAPHTWTASHTCQRDASNTCIFRGWALHCHGHQVLPPQ